MSAAVAIRPMRPEDVARSDLIAFEAFGAMPPRGVSLEERARHGQMRIAHVLETDPGGAWVAEGPDGRVAGVALALVRDGIWGLSLFAVMRELQGAGIGRRLLDAALTHAEGTRGALIASSEDPKALRRYARAGFDLRPCVAAAGIVHRPVLPARHPGLREGSDDQALEIAERVSRAVRGATHSRDIPTMVATGARVLTLRDDGFAVHADGSLRVLAAVDEPTAQALLWAVLAAAPAGATVGVDFITAGQDWAIEVLLEAGLALSPDGPFFTRGDVGPLRPYLPSGAYL